MLTINSASNWKIHHFAFFLLLTFTLSGCGFHLKQRAAIVAGFGPVSVQGISHFSTLYKAIRNTLRQSSISIVNDGSENHQIIISQVRNERRVLSVDSAGKVSEYELIKSLTFRVTDSNGNETMQAQTISTNRSYITSSTEVLGKGLEEEDINRRMEQSLVDRMFRYISSKSG